jgi:TolA-binding protein
MAPARLAFALFLALLTGSAVLLTGLAAPAWGDDSLRTELTFGLDQEAEFELTRAPDGTSVVLRIGRPASGVTAPSVRDDDPLVGGMAVDSPAEGGTVVTVRLRKRPVRAATQVLTGPFRLVLDLVYDAPDTGTEAERPPEAPGPFTMDVPMEADRRLRPLAPVVPVPPVGPGTEDFRRGVDAFDARGAGGARAGFEAYLRNQPDGAFAEAARYYLAELDFEAAQDGSAADRMAAAEAFDALGKRYPRSPNVALGLLRMSEALRQEMRLAEAAKVVGVVLDEYNDTPFAGPALGLRARIALQANHLRTALANYGRLFRAGGDDADGAAAAFGLAETLGRMGRYPDAVRFYEAGLAQRPGYPKSKPVMLEHMGRALMEAGRFADARTVFLLLYNLYPNRYPPDLALSQVADSFRGEGRWERAEAGYLDVIQNHPQGEGTLAARISLADLYVDRHRNIERPVIATQLVGSRVASSNAGELVSEAERLYGEVMDLAPTDALAEEARYKRAFLYQELGDGAAALDDLSELVSRHPDTDWRRPARELGEEALAEQATALLKSQQPAQAVALYRRHRDSLFGGHLRTWQVHYPLGLAHEAVGLTREAMRHYLALLGSSAPDTYRMRAVYRLGNLYLQQGEPAEALKRFAYFARRAPKAVTPELDLRIAQAHAALGQWNDAAAHYERFLAGRQGPAGLIDARLALADVYTQLGRADRARAQYAQVLSAPDADPGHTAQVRLRMGDMAFGLMRYEEARGDYRAAQAAGLSGEDADWAALRAGLAERALGRDDAAETALVALAKGSGTIPAVAGEVAGTLALQGTAAGRQGP